MNPQKENGYTPIANELLDAIIKLPLSGYESRVLGAILRKTYGYSKKEDHIALSQISEMTGIAKPHVSKVVTDLCNYLIVTKNGNKLGLNKHYQAWKVTKIGNSQKGKHLLHKSVMTVTEISNKKLHKSAPHKQKTNNTKTSDPYLSNYVLELLYYWNEIYKTSYRSVDPLLTNAGYWLKTYTLAEVKKAILHIQYDAFWKDKMTPTMLFRRKNPRGEEVDYIGVFLNIKPPAEERKAFMTPEEAKERGELW